MTLSAGTRLGPYEILAPLGAGGMGEVYRARDAKLDREVAVKVLPSQLTANPDALARFEREAKAVAALSHPNILAIFDFGTHEGVSYAVTELLEGETLRGKLDGSTVTQKQAVDWALQIAKGLSAAHGKGVVHRDLKPDNVFVTNDGHVKILDFGLAKRVDAASAEQTSAPTGTGGGHTEPGTVMGTMGYMSPEQVRGLPVDQRTDIFSFGAILYELLSGKKAFKRDTASDTIAAILKEEPPELTQSGRNVSPALDHIVRHCLEKDRENRFQTAKDVAFALSEASSPTTLSGVTSGSYVAPPSPRRGPGKGIWFIAAFTAIFAVAALLFWRPSKPGASASKGGATRIAVLPFENLGAPEDDYFADGMADEIRGKLTSLPGVQVIARGSSTPYKKTNKTPKQIAEELNASYLLTATVRWEKGTGASRVHVSPELVDVTRPDAPTSKWQQAFDASITDVFQVQSEISTRVAKELGVALGTTEARGLAQKPTQNLPAYEAYLRGEEASAGLSASDPASLRRALAFYEQAVALDPTFVQAWSEMATAISLLYANGVPSPELAHRAQQAAEKAIAVAPTRAEGYVALGTFRRLVLRDFAGALDLYRKAQAISPADVSLLTGIGNAEQRLGHFDRAAEMYRQASRLDPRAAANLRWLGDSLLRSRHAVEAREVLSRGLAIAPSSLVMIELRAMTFLSEGDLSGARASLQASASTVDPTALVSFLATYFDLGWVLDEPQRELLLRLTPSAFDDDRGAWGLALAQAYALQKDAANTQLHAGDAAKAVEQQLESAPDDSGLHAYLGWSLAYLGRKEEAIREGQRAVALTPISKDASFGPYFQQQLVNIYIVTGEPEKAIDQLEPLLKMPYYLTPGWLKIDPNFDPLRRNPRFQKLVAGAK
jgi:serine/threonine protein kinase/TolB-like protein/Flp pilus assembly protein TadD